MDRNPEIYVSADLEADGPIPGVYSMISVGLSVVGDAGINFYSEVKPISDTWDPDALAVSGLDRDRLLREAPAAGEVMSRMREWLLGLPGKPVLVLSPAAWDGMFLHWYFIRFLGENPLDVAGAAIDIRSYWMGMNNTTWLASRTKNIKASVGTLGVFPHTHHALDDSIEQGEVFARILARQRQQGPKPLQWLPKGLGEVLMRDLGIRPGPDLGCLRKRLTELCQTGELEADADPAYYVEAVKAYGLVGGLQDGQGGSQS
jgi:hypothetical protein